MIIRQVKEFNRLGLEQYEKAFAKWDVFQGVSCPLKLDFMVVDDRNRAKKKGWVLSLDKNDHYYFHNREKVDAFLKLNNLK